MEVGKGRRVGTHRSAILFAGLFAVALAVAVTGQTFAGAYASDLHWADEGSHFINGLLVHDYIAHGLPQNPLRYAIGYYANYPKVAIGHWPPFFYPLEGAFFFLAGPSAKAALFFQALIAAGLAAAVAATVTRLYGLLAGVIAALAVLAAPDVFASMLGVMLDIPLAFFAFLATLSWARYLHSGRWQWSLAFAAAATAAILTKGNGFFLALLPLITLFWRRDLLKSWSFWLPVPIVAVLTLPWYVATYKIAADGFNYSWGATFTLKAVHTYIRVLPGLIGIPGFIAALAGAARLFQHRETGWRQALGIAALGSVVAGFVYHCLVPVALEPRYLIPVVPDLVVLAFFALNWSEGWARRWRPVGIIAVAAIVLASEAAFPFKPDLGMARAGRLITAAPAKSPFVLVGSTPGGEGAITAEIASDDRSRSFYVLRGFEVLGSGNFMGTRYRPRFADDDALRNWIETNRIGWIVLDTSPESLKWRHNAQLAEVLKHTPNGWERVADLKRRGGSVQIYRVAAAFSGPVSVARLLPQLIPAKVIGGFRPH